ncbi:MAG: helix-turn-helix domain-containing protein, partial [Promethearchaeota archaeon]
TILSIIINEPWILKTVLENQGLVRFPLLIKDGCIQLEVIGERARLDEILTKFENYDVNFTIQQMTKYVFKSLLTKKQESILHTAFEFGYYDVPRRITLSELAEKFNISPSAMSESIRRIHRKLAVSYIKQSFPISF